MNLEDEPFTPEEWVDLMSDNPSQEVFEKALAKWSLTNQGKEYFAAQESKVEVSEQWFQQVSDQIISLTKQLERSENRTAGKHDLIDHVIDRVSESERKLQTARLRKGDMKIQLNNARQRIAYLEATLTKFLNGEEPF